MTSITTSTGLRVRLYTDGLQRKHVHVFDDDVLEMYCVGTMQKRILKGRAFRPSKSCSRYALGPEVLRAIAELIDGSTE